MTTVQRRRLIFLTGLSAYLIVLWVLWPTALVYPVKIFVVFLHELSHAGAAAATGGQVVSIALDPREGGATWVRGGNQFIILSAGYLGSLLWGLLLLWLARSRPRYARGAVQGLGMLTVLVTLVYVRGVFGIGFGLLFGGALFTMGRKLKQDAAALVLSALGVTSALYALLDIRSDILLQPGAISDAALLADLTGIHPLVWGVVWIAVALTACTLMLRRIWQRP